MPPPDAAMPAAAALFICRLMSAPRTQMPRQPAVDARRRRRAPSSAPFGALSETPLPPR